MCRACGLTWSSTGLVGVDAVVVAVIVIPLVLTPLGCIRKLLSWVLDLLAFLVAQLLSKSGSTGWAILYTAAAGNALLLIDAVIASRKGV